MADRLVDGLGTVARARGNDRSSRITRQGRVAGLAGSGWGVLSGLVRNGVRSIRGNVIHLEDCMTSPDLSQRPSDHIEVTGRAIDPAQVLSLAYDDAAGAVVLFLGTVRNHAPGREGVTHLEYEAYGGVVEDKIGEVVSEARDKWSLEKAVAVHRTGSLDVGEIAVAVAVSSAHRREAFAAGSYIIDELKARAPIWKKEHWPGGAEWVREDELHGSTD